MSGEFSGASIDSEAEALAPRKPQAMMTTCEQIKALCGGRPEAHALIEGIWGVVEVWDDAVDREHNEDERDIHAAFEFLLFDFQDNSFYHANRSALEAAMRLMVANWKCANTLESRGTETDLAHAYALRCSPYDFFVTVVYCASGPTAAEQAAHLLRCEQTDIDSFKDYVREHGKGL